jgi:hypothetical protein
MGGWFVWVHNKRVRQIIAGLPEIAGGNARGLTRPRAVGWCRMKPWRFPFKTLLVMGGLSFVLVDNPPLKIQFATTKDMVKLAEFYPLSSFSMYSTFSESPFLVFVTNARGEKVAIDTSLKTDASVLKKTYEMQLKTVKQQTNTKGRLTEVPLEIKQEAGRAALVILKARPTVQAWLASQPDKTLQLHEIILTAGEDGIERQETMVAEL